jgi:hypothetical protein
MMIDGAPVAGSSEAVDGALPRFSAEMWGAALAEPGA